MTSADIGVDLSKYDLGWSDAEDYIYKPKKGLNTDIINEMSWMKGEPAWMRDFRLKSYKRFENRPMPKWGGDMSEIYFDDIFYYCLLYTSPSPRDKRQSRMPSSA